MAGPRLIMNPGGGMKAAMTGRGRLPKLKIESRVGVMAPPDIIWEIISDLPGWGSWNPIYPAAAGELRIGAPLALTLNLPDQPPREIRPRVVDWVPLEQILWADTAWGGLVSTLRYLEIDQMGEAASIFSNGEQFQGMVSEIYGAQRRRSLRRGFTALSEAVKERAETLWRARTGETN